MTVRISNEASLININYTDAVAAKTQNPIENMLFQHAHAKDF